MSFSHHMCGPKTRLLKRRRVSRSLPRDADVILHGTVHRVPAVTNPSKRCHGDLFSKNIMVEGSHITSIIDWATGGSYPAYWEYRRMHDPCFMTPGWKPVLQEVFLGEPREREINAVREPLNAVAYTLA
jgi:hypothetical protein